MIATGPKPPLSFNSSNDESPVKLNIGGGGMGEPELCSFIAGVARCVRHGHSSDQRQSTSQTVYCWSSKLRNTRYLRGHWVLRVAGGGLFTSTNPEIRRVVPDSVDGRIKLKVVYVVLEAQYQSALTAAVRNINATRDQVNVHRSACCIHLMGSSQPLLGRPCFL
jgi:hypothetical protein